MKLRSKGLQPKCPSLTRSPRELVFKQPFWDYMTREAAYLLVVLVAGPGLWKLLAPCLRFHLASYKHSLNEPTLNAVPATSTTGSSQLCKKPYELVCSSYFVANSLVRHSYLSLQLTLTTNWASTYLKHQQARSN